MSLARKSLSLLRHALTNRPWLMVAFALGFVAFGLLLPMPMHMRARVLIAWNITQWAYILRILLLMVGADAAKIRRTAITHDESAKVVLAFFSMAALVTLGGIFFEIISSKDTEGAHKLLRLGLPAISLAGTWLLLPLIFAVNYAHNYYCAAPGKRPLKFPDDIENPSYWDFVYFSITIAVASQTADIAVTSSPARRMVLVQSMLSFLFNTAVLGLTINLAASLLG